MCRECPRKKHKLFIVCERATAKRTGTFKKISKTEKKIRTKAKEDYLKAHNLRAVTCELCNNESYKPATELIDCQWCLFEGNSSKI
jgi:hypothetical protein